MLKNDEVHNNNINLINPKFLKKLKPESIEMKVFNKR